MQEWKKREKKSMTQDTEVEVARVNRGMSIRRSKKKSNLLNDARIKTCISRYDTHAFSFYALSATALDRTALDRTICVQKTAVRSRTSMTMTTQEEVSVDSGDDQPSLSRCWIFGSLRGLHDSTARHTTSACALWTPALLWFLYHKD